MALGSEMDDTVNLLVLHQLIESIEVADVHLDKLIIWFVLDVLEIGKVACLEGIAFRKGWITADKMRELAKPMLKNQYGQYLLQVVEEVERTGKANL